LFLWYSFSAGDLIAERALIEKRGEESERRKKDFELRYASASTSASDEFQRLQQQEQIEQEEATLHSIHRVNVSLWNFQNMYRDDFDFRPLMFVLSDSLADDGVLRFRGNFSSNPVSTSTSTSASSGKAGTASAAPASAASVLSMVSSAYDIENEVKAVSMSEAFGSSSTTTRGRGGGSGSGSKNSGLKLRGGEKNSLDSDDIEDSNDLVSILAKASSSSSSSSSSSQLLLDDSTPNEAVRFIRNYANPGLLEPYFEAERSESMRSFRFVALLFVNNHNKNDKCSSHNFGGGAPSLDREYNAMITDTMFFSPNDAISSSSSSSSDNNKNNNGGKKSADADDDSMVVPSSQSYNSDHFKKGLRTGKLLPFQTYTAGVGSRQHLVPLFVLNTIFHADIVAQLSLALDKLAPCFAIYDRRDRRVLVDRREFVPRRGDDEMLRRAALSIWHRAQLSTSPLATFLRTVQRRQEEEEVAPSADGDDNEEATATSEKKSGNNNKNKNSKNTKVTLRALMLSETPILAEPTTLPGKAMAWIEDLMPWFRRTRMWLRLDPETMLFTLGAGIVAVLFVGFLIFIFYLVQMPTESFEKLVFGSVGLVSGSVGRPVERWLHLRRDGHRPRALRRPHRL